MKNRPYRRPAKPVLWILTLFLIFMFQGCQQRPDDSTNFDALVTSISITPANPTLADPTTQQLTAVGRYSDGSTADITDSVNWVSEDPTIATVGDDLNGTSNAKGILNTIITGSTTITVRSGDVTGTTLVTVTSAQLNRIEITPAYTTFASVVTPWVQMKATGIYDDGTILDLTNFATWSRINGTGDVNVSNVSGSKGVAANNSAGTASITASFQGVSSTTDIVLDGGIAVDLGLPIGPLRFSPLYPSFPLGAQQQFTATALLDNGKTKDVTKFVVWTETPGSGDATISNSQGTKGLATATLDGTVQIDADFDGNTGTASIPTIVDTYLYELKVDPEYPMIAPGIPYQLRAVGVFKDSGTDFYYTIDMTEQVSWSTSDSSMLTISNSAGSRGLVTQTKIPGAADRTATISIKSPLLSTLTGSTTLTIKSNNLELTSIAISPSDPTIHIDTTPTFKAYGTFSDGTISYIQDISKAVIWSSSDNAVSVVSNEYSTAGKVVNRTDGITNIIATMKSVTGNSSVTVKPATYTISTLVVTPATPLVCLDTKVQMMAMATFLNGDSFTQNVTDEVTWTSTVEGNAMVSNADGTQGLVHAVSNAGPSNITADWRTALTNFETTTIQLSATITGLAIVTPGIMGINGAYQLTAEADYSGTKQDITQSGTWSSSLPAVASVSDALGSKGKVIYNGSGTTTITFQIHGLANTTTLPITVP